MDDLDQSKDRAEGDNPSSTANDHPKVQESADPLALTIGQLLFRLFPQEGEFPYLAFPSPDGSDPDAYATPPLLPPDVFAAAGHVVEMSGAYHHIVPEIAGHVTTARRLIEVSADDLDSVRNVARAWREFRPERDFNSEDPAVFASWLESSAPQLRALYAWWSDVFEVHASAPVFSYVPASNNPPSWWRSAVFLTMAADEAAGSVGFSLAQADQLADPYGQAQVPFVSALIEYNIGESIRQRTKTLDDKSRAVEVDGVTTISVASPDVLSVLPKARTTAVGCTMRSLSHNLALLPPRGVARASWMPFTNGDMPPDEEQMNLLLVPFPFSIPSHAFRPSGHYGADSRKWGFFDVEQVWLRNVTPAKLLAFIEALAAEAKRECRGIHGVILPELALDSVMYGELSRRLPDILPEIEVFISGQSGDAVKRSGNFVSVTVYQRDGDTPKRAIVTQREKHHRWKLDRAQIISYGLEGVLSPSISWWENIDLLSRRVDFQVVRSGSVISAMICEDLARVDPCQELLRSVGPSIVFALLMDAPQIKYRWPARYATILAEDPGSAVLTLTSRALMTRQQRLGTHKSTGERDRIIALWRDDAGEPIEIDCPMDHHAVRLTLSGGKVPDTSLDGRTDPSAVCWRYAKHKPVGLRDVVDRFAEVLGEDDVAMQGR